jgi:hypothetical protein
MGKVGKTWLYYIAADWGCQRTWVSANFGCQQICIMNFRMYGSVRTLMIPKSSLIQKELLHPQA